MCRAVQRLLVRTHAALLAALIDPSCCLCAVCVAA